MPRDLALSNGRLLVMFDHEYRIRDIYFPHVGMENHGAGHPFRFGVWVDGPFGWMGDEWKPDMRYADCSMVTEVRARNPRLGVELLGNDAVDFYENVLIRRVRITNLADRRREIRCFLHQDFHIKGNDVGDTVFYSPEADALIHYKEDRYFLMSCKVDGRSAPMRLWHQGRGRCGGDLAGCRGRDPGRKPDRARLRGFHRCRVAPDRPWGGGRILLLDCRRSRLSRSIYHQSSSPGQVARGVAATDRQLLEGVGLEGSPQHSRSAGASD